VINDEYGHLYGDQVLLAVADALRRSVRGHEAVARMGGEEFAILLPDADADAAYDAAERVRREIAEVPVACAALSCSAGVASASPADASPVDLLAQADRALYRAKRLGRARTVASRSAATHSGLA
jgi:diguanylate cyclase (GGDEF)-like protein